MEQILSWITTNYALISLMLLAAFIFGLLIFIIVIYRLNRLARQYKALLRNGDGKNLEEVIINNSKTLERVLLKIDVFEEQLSETERLAKKSIQRVGMVRFNAFDDIGGDLSYALALLDQNGDGVVISSIYGRDDARTYAKTIKQGKSSYQLSTEEEQAIINSVRNRDK